MAARPLHKPPTPASGPALLPVEQYLGKPAIALKRPVYVIGSRANARIHLISSSVSKAHALLVRSNGRFYLRDLGSRTKVFINGVERREADLKSGDLIKIGSFTFRYIAGPGEEHPSPPVDFPIPAKLDVVGADYPVAIEERAVLIGRRSLCDITLAEASVSVAHAVIFEANGQRYIRDLGSRTSTFVNGVSTDQHQLAEGDIVRIGETELRYLHNQLAEVKTSDPSHASGAIPSLMEVDEHPAGESNAGESHQAEIPAAPPLAEMPIDAEIPIDAELPLDADGPVDSDAIEPDSVDIAAIAAAIEPGEDSHAGAAIEIPAIEIEAAVEAPPTEAAIKEPVIDEPEINEPEINEPAISEQPVIDEPAIAEPVFAEPHIAEPVIDEPPIEPVMDEIAPAEDSLLVDSDKPVVESVNLAASVADEPPVAAEAPSEASIEAPIEAPARPAQAASNRLNCSTKSRHR
jgi:pSer/pThr/pTyr-binding forkhead associated (FHA) protein